MLGPLVLTIEKTRILQVRPEQTPSGSQILTRCILTMFVNGIQRAGNIGTHRVSDDFRPYLGANHRDPHVRFSKDPADGGYPVFDFWPDTSDYDDSELYSVPSVSPSRLRVGASGKLFSSSHPATIARHFRMLAAHRIDGVFFQRWANQCLVPESISGHPADPASYSTTIAKCAPSRR